MKSILIIGMGRFGRHLCKNLSQLGNQVMIVDEKEEIWKKCFLMWSVRKLVTVPMKMC